MTSKSVIALRFIFILFALFFALTVHAANSHFGNFTASSGQVDVHGQGYAGGTQSVLEIFGLTQSMSPSTMSLRLSKSGTPTGNYVVTLCAYPDELLADPCSRNVQATWSGSFSNLTTTAAWINLDMSGTFLYPSVGYGIHIKLTNLQTGSNYLNVFTNSGSYADGTFFTARTGCTGSDIWNMGFLCGNNTALAGHDMLFDIFGGTAAAITINTRQNGPEVSFFGSCVMPADQPDSWTLNSNLVSILVTGGATSTAVLAQAPCVDSVYDSASNSRRLWNGSFTATASQAGTPHTYSAQTTFTVTGSEVVDPTAALHICTDVGILDVITDPKVVSGAISCSFNAFLSIMNDQPPFLWVNQIKDALSASSTPATVDATLHWPNAQAFTLYSSTSSTAGVTGVVNGFPPIGGLTVRQWIETFLWIGFIGYALSIPYRFLRR